MGCATGMVKYFVFLANLIFALAGLALVIIGLLYKFNYSEATNALPSNFGVAPILSIIIGAIVFVTAFLGCCGAVKESPCMLTTYAIILLVIFIIQVAIGVYAFIKINQDEQDFRRMVRDGLQKTFDGYNSNNEKKEAVDAIQSWLQCCGLDHPESMRMQNDEYPKSCCSEKVTTCRSTDYLQFYNTPCERAARDFLQKSSNVIGGVAIGIAVVEFKCCGLEGPDEWRNSTLPNTCCPDNIRPCYLTETEVYHNGCIATIQDGLRSSLKIVGGIALGIALAELVGAFFALCLTSSIRNQYRRSRYA